MSLFRADGPSGFRRFGYKTLSYVSFRLFSFRFLVWRFACVLHAFHFIVCEIVFWSYCLYSIISFARLKLGATLASPALGYGRDKEPASVSVPPLARPVPPLTSPFAPSCHPERWGSFCYFIFTVAALVPVWCCSWVPCH